MNILFITSAPITSTSSANISNIAIIKGLLHIGHNVTILCADSNLLNNKNLLKSLGIEKAKVLPIPYTLPTIMHNDNNKRRLWLKPILRGALRDLFHSFSIYDHYKILIKKLVELNIFNNYYDVMITASDPKSSHLIGEWIYFNKRECYGKWIQLFGDPILIDITNKLKLPGFYIKSKEERLIKLADEVVYVSPLTLEQQRKIYSKHRHKMHFIPIPYIKEKIYDNNLIDYANLKVGYFGDYYSSIRNLKPLYDYVISNDNIHLYLYGNSDLTLRNVDNVTVKPRVPLNELEKIESEVDILIGVCNLKGTQIPGKIYHYAATNKPVLIIIDGNEKTKKILKSYIAGFNRFIICENNGNSIEEAFIEFNSYNKRINNSPVKSFHYVKVAEEISLLF